MLPGISPLKDHCRGIGPADMANAIMTGGSHRASADIALHVLDIIDCLMRSSRENRPVTVQTRCQKPAALTEAELNQILQKG